MITKRARRITAAERRRYYDSGFWGNNTIFQLVEGNARTSPDHFAVRDRHRRLTYAQLITGVERLAADLSRTGLKTGQRVAVWLPNRLETVMAFLACSKRRYVCCPSFHRTHTVDEVMNLLERIGASAVITEQGFGADADDYDVSVELTQLLRKPKHYRLQALTADDAGKPPFGELQASGGLPADNFTVDPNDVVYLPLTSGSTGKPKGVMHSDNTLLANARAIAGDWHLDSQSVVYTLSPLSHNLGFGAMVTALYAGGEIVLGDLRRSESLMTDLRNTQATFIYGVPAHAVDLLRELRHAAKGSLDKITGFRISGAPVPAHVAAELIEYGIVPQTGYGMTEAHSHNYTLPDDEPRRIIETAGRACPGYEVKIWGLQDNNTELAPGEVGQIGGKGASLMLGYCAEPDVTEDAFNSLGWFMTGDLGSLDEDGYLRIVGRIKDVIIRGGHNIYPARLEQLAARHPGIDMAAAIPVPDERLGERICLVIKPAPDGAPDPEQLIRQLDAEGLSIYERPEYLVEVEDMPLTASGKLSKRSLLRSLEEGRIVPQPVCVLSD